MARGLSRPSMLDSARRASRAQVARRVQRMSAPSGRTVVGVLVAYEEGPEPRAEVEVVGSTLWLGATPGGYIAGGGVHVQVDDQGRPFWVVGPTGTPVPDSLVPTTPGEGAVPIVVQPDLSIDPVARARNEQIGQDLEDARQALTDVQGLLAAIGAADGPEGVAQAVSEFLDIEVDPDDVWSVVVARFLVATEKIITSDVIADGAVTARTLDVVSELAGGASLSITDDGIRMWRAGNPPATGQPNVVLTTTDGFRIQTDTGDGLLWIDPATGDLHTAGAVTSGGTITGATINIPGAFYASPAAGVAVGGAVQIYTRGTYTSTAESGFFTDPVPVAPGRTYRALYRLERSTNTGDDHHQVWVVWFNGGTEVSRRILVGHPGAPLYDEGSVTDAAFTAPAGVTHVRLLFTRDIAPVTTRVSDIAVFETSEGNITVSGDVRGSTGVFDRLQVGGTVIEGQQGDITGARYVWCRQVGISDNEDGQIIFGVLPSGQGRVRVMGAWSNTTTSSANVYVATNGTLARSTSSRRFKNDIQDIPEDWAERILDLNPKTWIDAGEAAEHKEGDPPLRRVPGLVAEDVEDAGLSAYVTYADGQVQGLSYDRLWTLFIPVVRKQRDRITDLEQKVTALEQQVADLTARLDRLDPEGA